MKNSVEDNRIGIMSVEHEGRKPFGKQTYFFEDMAINASEKASDLFFFSPLNWNDNKKEVPGYNFVDNRWVATKGKIPNIIYDRSFSKDEEQKLQIEGVRTFLKDSNKTILNPFGLADLLNNKIEFHTFLEKHDIPTLGTFPFDSRVKENIFEVSGTSKVYIKPTYGSKGEGIYVAQKKGKRYLLFDNIGNSETFNDYNQLIEELQSKIQFQDRYFVQAEANTVLIKKAPFDIRVLVQNYGDNYEITGKAVRIGQKLSMTSNLNSGGIAMPIEELAEFFKREYVYALEELHHNIDKLCLNCSNAIRDEIGDFCEIGFDILVTKDKGPIIIEGNAKPSRWVFVKIADYLERIGKDNSYYLDRRKETVSVPLKYASYLLGK